jgi:hypothetical protein
MHGEQHSQQLATNENQAPNSEEPTVDETTDTTSTPLQHPLSTNPAIVHHPTQQPEQPVVSAPTSRQSVVYNAPAIIEAAGPVVQLNLEEGITIDILLNTYNQGLFSLHYRWVKPMRTITSQLIQTICAMNDESEIASAAFFILPGLLKALTILKSPKPADFLKSCISPTFLPHLPYYIIQRAAFTHDKVQAMRERSARQAVIKPPSSHRRRAEHIVLTRYRRRVEKMFKDGRYGAATRVVEQAHAALSDPNADNAYQAPSLEQTRSHILALNPVATEQDLLPGREDDPETEPFHFDAGFVQRCVRDLPKGSANGASGWTYNTIHQLYANPSEGAAFHLDALAAFLTRLANGTLPNHVWTTSRAVLIPKPEVGKFRPIGIGEAWYRLLGRCILKEIGGEVGELLAPIQMGCGVSGGSEIAARMSQVFLDAHSGHVLIKTDFKNAFNLTPRRLILEGLQAFCPRLIPWFRWAYGEPSPLVDSQGHTVGSSQRGCRQGDPLAALLFCVAIQGALKEVSDLLQHASDEATQGMSPIPMTQLQHPGTVLAYMDDCTIAVPSCLANRVAADLSDIFAASGLILNVQKCRFIGPEAAHIEDPVFACNPEGDVVLGSPTGTEEYRALQCLSMVGEMEACLPTLVRLQVDPLIATNLIRYCVNSKPSYLARVQEPQMSIQALKRFDMAVDLALCRTAEHVPRNPALPEDRRRTIHSSAVIRSLPLHHGGFGIQRHSWVSGQVGCIRSRILTRAFVQQYFAETEGFADAIGRWPAMGIGDNPLDEPDVPGVDLASADLRNLAEAAFIAKASMLHNLLLTDGMNAHAAWFLSSQFEGSGRWISPPIGMHLPPHLIIRKEEYRQAIRARLLLHPLEEQLMLQPELVTQCFCHRAPLQQQQGQQMQLLQHAVISTTEPFHCLDCVRAKGWMKGRHDAVVQLMEKFIKKRFQDATVTKEPAIQTRPEVHVQLRADLLVCLPPQIGRHFIIDVTVSNPAAPTFRAPAIRSHEVPQATNIRRDKDKTAHYHELSFPDITLFTPQRYFTFNVEATGRLGASACLFVEELYRASGRLWELDNLIGPSPIQSLLRDIVTVVAKFNAQAMLFHKRNVSTAAH